MKLCVIGDPVGQHAPMQHRGHAVTHRVADHTELHFISPLCMFSNNSMASR